MISAFPRSCCHVCLARRKNVRTHWDLRAAVLGAAPLPQPAALRVLPPAWPVVPGTASCIFQAGRVPCGTPHPGPKSECAPFCPVSSRLVFPGAGAQAATLSTSRDPAPRPFPGSPHPGLLEDGHGASLRPTRVLPLVTVSSSHETPAWAGRRRLGGAGQQPKLSGFFPGK